MIGTDCDHDHDGPINISWKVNTRLVFILFITHMLYAFACAYHTFLRRTNMSLSDTRLYLRVWWRLYRDVTQWNQRSTFLDGQLPINIYWPCYCTIHVYVVIHLCDSIWSFWMEANLCRFFNICIAVGDSVTLAGLTRHILMLVPS